jgi:hypothetical protein
VVERTVEVTLHTCPGCGDEFEPSRPEQSWCQRACYRAWARKRALRCEVVARKRDIERFLSEKHPSETLH